MNKPLAALRAALKAVALAHPDRADFNQAIRMKFKHIADGSYRSVYFAGDYVIKLRRVDHRWEFKMGEAGNRTERKNWLNLSQELRFFVLDPTLVRLPNKHDAVIMKRVHTYLDHGMTRDFTPIMHEQYRFITNTFLDSHIGNIGWDKATERVWLIDYNHGANLECRDNERSSDAKNIIKQYSSSRSERKAA